MKIVAQAIAAVGDDSEKIKQYLYQMPEYDGLVGKFKFDQNGDVAGGPFFTNFLITEGTKQLLAD